MIMIEKVWYLDAQTLLSHSDEEESKVKDEIIKLWSDFELGNDHHMLHINIEGILEGHPNEVTSTPLVDYLRKQGLKDDEQVILHYWW